jgi:hypothetical protein
MSTGFSSIDLRLAIRMLVRYPGITLVGVFGMAVGMAIATAVFTIVFSLLDPIVPLESGDRVVSLVNWDVATNNREQHLMHDFATWRELASVEDIGVLHIRSCTAGRVTDPYGRRHSKFAASSVLPLPLYRASCG